MGKVTVRSTLLRGKSVWVVDRRVGGIRERSFFGSKAEADQLAKEVQKDMQEIAEAWRDLTVDEKIRLVLVHRESQRRNLDLLKVVTTYQAEPPKEPESTAPTLKVALSQLGSAKLESGRARRYVDHLDSCLRRFTKGREEAKIDRVTSAEVNLFLEDIPPKSRPHFRAMISTLFSFALRKRWVAENPVEKVERVKRVEKPPAVFTPKQLETCLKWLCQERPRALAWFVLTTLCGLRPEEATQTRWDQIQLAEGLVVVEAQTSKVRRRRIVYPQPSALEWLRFAQRNGSDLPLHQEARRRAYRGMREALGWKDWPKDITRHSAASYWLAECGSAERVATMLGHSLDMLHRHYKALVTRDQASAYWGIAPDREI